MPTTETTITRLQARSAELLAAIAALDAQPAWVRDDPKFVRKRRELGNTYVSAPLPTPSRFLLEGLIWGGVWSRG
jgi:hypothetical protein